MDTRKIRTIGEEFDYTDGSGTHRLLVEEANGTSCGGCYFEPCLLGNTDTTDAGLCVSSLRTDKKEVIFKNVDNGKD